MVTLEPPNLFVQSLCLLFVFYVMVTLEPHNLCAFYSYFMLHSRASKFDCTICVPSIHILCYGHSSTSKFDCTICVPSIRILCYGHSRISKFDCTDCVPSIIFYVMVTIACPNLIVQSVCLLFVFYVMVTLGPPNLIVQSDVPSIRILCYGHSRTSKFDCTICVLSIHILCYGHSNRRHTPNLIVQSVCLLFVFYVMVTLGLYSKFVLYNLCAFYSYFMLWSL